MMAPAGGIQASQDVSRDQPTGTRPRRIFITVAEVSGDKHAAQLIRSLKKLDPTIIIEGFGGPEMAAAGAVIHRNTVTKAAMGWRGVLRAFEMMDALKWVRNRFDTERPDLQIGVDSPSLNFHFARAAHDRGIPVMQYVAPQLWAWAPWRMKKLRKWVDRVACILPFEEKYFQSHGVNATFVGHPLFDELPPNRGENRTPRFPETPPVIGLLPGSRKSEAVQNFPHLLDVAAQIRKQFPAATFLVPTTAATQPIVEAHVQQTPGLVAEVGQDAFDEMVPRCDLCITVSGTATLHVAGFGVPMIVVYRSNWLQWNGAARWLVRTRTFALVNLLANSGVDAQASHHLVREFVPWYGSNEPVAREAIGMLKDPAKLEACRHKLRQLVGSLDRPGASDQTARLALEIMEARRALPNARR
ncbi:MAG TPA: lipid-A-disaccharide synthase [Tepidisphaeraceae bacterium]|jgi:lipid-A-disaccharide synthase